jgi:hypothetical protein
MKNDEFNKEIKKAIEDNYSNLIDDGVDDKEHVERLSEEFFNKISIRDQKYKKRRTVLKHLSIIAASVVIIFFGTMYLAYIPQAQAFRFNIENAFNEIFNNGQDKVEDETITKYYSSYAEIDKDLADQLPYFNWLPEGFRLQGIQLTDVQGSVFAATINYNNGSNGYIDIAINPYSDSDGSGYINDSKFQIVEINNMKVGISSDEPYNAVFFYKGSYLVSINSSIDKDSLINLIKSIT